MMQDPETPPTGYYLFGRDALSLPCFRDAALAGLATGFGVGMLYFLFTSHGRKSIRYAYMSFIGVTFPYCYICMDRRYKQLMYLHEAAQKIAARGDESFLMTDSLDLEFGHESWG